MTPRRYSISSSRGTPVHGRPYVVLDGATRPGKIVEAHRTPAAAQKAADRLNRKCAICGEYGGHTAVCPGSGTGPVYYGDDEA